MSIFYFLSKNKEQDIQKDNTELLIICIDKMYQNKGIGSILISESLNKYISFLKSIKIFCKNIKKDKNNVFF